MSNLQNNAIQNFISSLDLSIDKIHHYRNATRDCMSYKWPCSMLLEILVRIEEAYSTQGANQ